MRYFLQIHATAFPVLIFSHRMEYWRIAQFNSDNVIINDKTKILKF